MMIMMIIISIDLPDLWNETLIYDSASRGHISEIKEALGTQGEGILLYSSGRRDNKAVTQETSMASRPCLHSRHWPTLLGCTQPQFRCNKLICRYIIDRRFCKLILSITRWEAIINFGLRVSITSTYAFLCTQIIMHQYIVFRFSIRRFCFYRVRYVQPYNICCTCFIFNFFIFTYHVTSNYVLWKLKQFLRLSVWLCNVPDFT